MIVVFTVALAAPLPLPTGPGSMAHALSAHDEVVDLVWVQPSDEGASVLYSVWQEDAWSEPAVVVRSPSLFVNQADTPKVGRAGDGSRIVTFPRKSGAGTYAYDVVVARSVDGRRWTELGSPHRDGTETEHGFVSLLPEGAGIRLFWLDGRETAASGPMTLRSATWDGGFTPSTTLDDRVCDCCDTSAALGPQGWRVVYRDRDEGEVRDILALDATGATQPVGEDGWVMPGCPVNGPGTLHTSSGWITAWATGVGGLEVRVATSKEAWVVEGAATEPVGRVDLASTDDGAVVTWLGKDGVFARRLRVRDGLMLGGEPVRLGSLEAEARPGFPRSVRHGDALWTVWRGEAGLQGVRTPLTALPAAEVALPRVARAVREEVPFALDRLQVKTLDGVAGRIELTRERTLVLTWASWCGPCRGELAALATLREAYPDLGLVVVAVDDAADAIQRVAPVRVGSWWLADRAGVRGALGRDDVPRSWLVTRAGEVVWQATGALDLEKLKELVGR